MPLCNYRARLVLLGLLSEEDTVFLSGITGSTAELLEDNLPVLGCRNSIKLSSFLWGMALPVLTPIYLTKYNLIGTLLRAAYTPAALNTIRPFVSPLSPMALVDRNSHKLIIPLIIL